MILPPPLRVIPILTTGPGPPRFARDLQGGMTAVDGPTVLSPIYAAARGGPFPGPSASVAPPSIHHVAEPLPGPHTLQVFHKLSERFLQERGSRQVGRHDHPGVRPQGAVGGEGFLLEDVEDRPPGPPLLQGRKEGLLLDHRPPAHVDEDGAGPHGCPLRPPKHPPRLLREGCRG